MTTEQLITLDHYFNATADLPQDVRVVAAFIKTQLTNEATPAAEQGAVGTMTPSAGGAVGTMTPSQEESSPADETAPTE